MTLELKAPRGKRVVTVQQWIEGSVCGRSQAEVPGVRNAHMRAAVHGGELKFLYEVADGPTHESYGVEVQG